MLLKQYISYKENLIQHVANYHLFTANYPLLLEHILREAKKYDQNLSDIESGINLNLHVFISNLNTSLETHDAKYI